MVNDEEYVVRQVWLPIEQDTVLRQFSAHTSKSKSEIISQAVSEYIAREVQKNNAKNNENT